MWAQNLRGAGSFMLPKKSIAFLRTIKYKIMIAILQYLIGTTKLAKKDDPSVIH